MKGIRTILANAVGAFIIPPIVGALDHVGITLTDDQKLALTAQIFAAGNMILRRYTSTPIGMAVSATVATPVVQDVGAALYDVLLKEQERRKSLSKESTK